MMNELIKKDLVEMKNQALKTGLRYQMKNGQVIYLSWKIMYDLIKQNYHQLLTIDSPDDETIKLIERQKRILEMFETLC